MLTIVSNMQPGWNLGNTLDATGGETSWGNPMTTKAMIDAIAETGFKSIRIPITWSLRSGDAPEYTISEVAFKRVKEIMDWALDNRLYIIVNLHHDSDWVRHMDGNHDETLARFKAYWTQIAERLAAYPEEVMFESINEPRFSEDWNKNETDYFTWTDELNTAFYEIIRASGGTNAVRPLLMPTIACSAEQRRMEALYKTISRLGDPNLIATVHYYGHYHFSVNVGGITTFNATVQNDIDAMLKRCADTFINNGIPVIIGEYGLLAFDRDINGVQHGEMLQYFEYLTQAARAYHIPLMLWDNGQHFDRRNLVWRDRAFIDTLINSLSGRSSSLERDCIFIKKQALITDTPLKVNLNGNEFIGVYHGETKLNDPADYRFEDGVLVFTANFLLTLPSHPLGETAALRCQFSNGPDWIVRVIQYDTPVLMPAAKTGHTLTIPTAFNGDELETMQAFVINDGKPSGNAGPDSWTAYKQMSRCYIPSYEAQTVTITKELLYSVEADEILLRFQFLSGEAVDYHIMLDGDSVIGKPVVLHKPKPQDSAPHPFLKTAPVDNKDESDLREATDYAAAERAFHEKNWLSRAWERPVVKVAAGAVGALMAAVVTAGVLKLGPFTRKKK